MSKAGWCACTSAKLLVLAQRNSVAEQEAFSLNPPTPSQLSIFFCAIVCFFPLHHLFAIFWGWLKGKNTLIKSGFSIIRIPIPVLF